LTSKVGDLSISKAQTASVSLGGTTAGASTSTAPAVRTSFDGSVSSRPVLFSPDTLVADPMAATKEANQAALREAQQVLAPVFDAKSELGRDPEIQSMVSNLRAGQGLQMPEVAASLSEGAPGLTQGLQLRMRELEGVPSAILAERSLGPRTMGALNQALSNPPAQLSPEARASVAPTALGGNAVASAASSDDKGPIASTQQALFGIGGKKKDDKKAKAELKKAIGELLFAFFMDQTETAIDQIRKELEKQSGDKGGGAKEDPPKVTWVQMAMQKLKKVQEKYK
jgi:hypothetical protein